MPRGTRTTDRRLVQRSICAFESGPKGSVSNQPIIPATSCGPQQPQQQHHHSTPGPQTAVNDTCWRGTESRSARRGPSELSTSSTGSVVNLGGTAFVQSRRVKLHYTTHHATRASKKTLVAQRKGEANTTPRRAESWALAGRSRSSGQRLLPPPPTGFTLQTTDGHHPPFAPPAFTALPVDAASSLCGSGFSSCWGLRVAGCSSLRSTRNAC